MEAPIPFTKACDEFGHSSWSTKGAGATEPNESVPVHRSIRGNVQAVKLTAGCAKFTSPVVVYHDAYAFQEVKSDRG